MRNEVKVTKSTNVTLTYNIDINSRPIGDFICISYRIPYHQIVSKVFYQQCRRLKDPMTFQLTLALVK